MEERGNEGEGRGDRKVEMKWIGACTHRNFRKSAPMPTKCTFQRCIDYVDVSRRSAARGRQTRQGWVKSAVFYL